MGTRLYVLNSIRNINVNYKWGSGRRCVFSWSIHAAGPGCNSCQIVKPASNFSVAFVFFLLAFTIKPRCEIYHITYGQDIANQRLLYGKKKSISDLPLSPYLDTDPGGPAQSWSGRRNSLVWGTFDIMLPNCPWQSMTSTVMLCRESCPWWHLNSDAYKIYDYLFLVLFFSTLGNNNYWYINDWQKDFCA